jgi:endonuclease/exonuclease/phosphatase (EEP) superfamily protein YafD
VEIFIKPLLFITQSILAITLLLTIAAFFGYRRRYFELASHFRLQYLISSLVCLLALTALSAWASAAAALICLFINLAEIAPLHFSAARSGAPGRRLKLILANVNFGNNQFGRLIEFVTREQPDLLVAQEITEQWAEELRQLRSQFAFIECIPAARGCGIAVFSRHSMSRLELRIVEADSRPGIMARIDCCGASFALLTIHPRTPIRQSRFETRNRLMEQAAEHLNGFSIPRILIGDLNTTPWSPHFRRLLRISEMKDARRGFGLLPTWPTELRSRALMIPIDHCLVSSDIEVIGIAAGDPIGSDHLPLVIDLGIPALKSESQTQNSHNLED